MYAVSENPGTFSFTDFCDFSIGAPIARAPSSLFLNKTKVILSSTSEAVEQMFKPLLFRSPCRQSRGLGLFAAMVGSVAPVALAVTHIGDTGLLDLVLG